MSKIKRFLKRPAQVWQRFFGFLPVISFGGMAFILGFFALVPNFMNFAHAEEKPALKPSDIKLAMSVDETFHKFNDVYLTSDGVDQEDQKPVAFKPSVETNNPAGYKVFFSDVDEDTNMRSIDATVTDTIRSATASDFENGVPKILPTTIGTVEFYKSQTLLLEMQKKPLPPIMTCQSQSEVTHD